MKTEPYNGLLAVNKPSGLTSHDVVVRLRHLIGQQRIGHTGTLDPAAQGLLLLCLGKATRVARFVSDCDKTYRAIVELGRTSTTYDREGLDKTMAPNPVPPLELEGIRAICDGFVGIQQQQVPVHSAVRLKGERMYKLARRGRDVEAPIREVRINAISVLAYDEPDITMDISCGSGTYIRSLAHDMGQRIGCGAYLQELTRTAIGGVTLNEALTLEDVENHAANGTLKRRMLSLETVLPYGIVGVRKEFVPSVRNGRVPSYRDIDYLERTCRAGERIILRNGAGQVLAVARCTVTLDEIGKDSSEAILTYERVLA